MFGLLWMPWVELGASAEWNSIVVFSVAAVASVVVAGAVVAADTAADVAVVVNNDGDGAYGGPMDKEQLSKGCC